MSSYPLILKLKYSFTWAGFTGTVIFMTFLTFMIFSFCAYFTPQCFMVNSFMIYKYEITFFKCAKIPQRNYFPKFHFTTLEIINLSLSKKYSYTLMGTIQRYYRDMLSLIHKIKTKILLSPQKSISQFFS